MKHRNMHERMMAVVRGDDLDRVPFVQYDNCAAPNTEIWSALGQDELGLMRWCSAHRFEHPNCAFEESRISGDGLDGLHTTLVTPAGRLERVIRYDPTYHSPATEQHFVRMPEDYRILAAYLRDLRVVEDTSTLEKAAAELGDRGLPLCAVSRTPYQQLWVQWVSLENLSIHFMDVPDVLEEITSLLQDIQRRIHAVVRDVSLRISLPFVDIPDNITAPTIGVDNFRRYCLPLYRELAQTMGKETPVIAHMDGDLKPLWSDIAQSGLRGIDSLSPPPDNDTSVADAVRNWPGMRLFVNFPSSVHVGSPERVYQAASQLLQEGGRTGQMWIQISENVPPGVWRTSFPMIVRAIHDFGLGG